MLKNVMTYGYNDICVQPCAISTIEHRSECNVFKNDMLPIFTAPMSSVISEENVDLFEENHIIPIIPRNASLKSRMDFLEKGKWVAFSISEFEHFISEPVYFTQPVHILLDVANGNMKKLFKLSKEAKKKIGKDKIILMAGNIANPESYLQYCMAGIDYVRCGIGGGNGCVTSSNCAIHMGIVNLLTEINNIREGVHKTINQHKALGNENICKYACETQVIADGGIRNYSDVIKALALGADYVMIGSVFSQLIESCAKTFTYNKNGELVLLDPLADNIKIQEQGGLFYIEEDGHTHVIDHIYKRFYGMASKRGQEDLFGHKKGTAEGIEKTLDCTTNISKWTENMKDYLASAMSYCGLDDIKDLNPDNVDTYLMSPNLQNSINK
jgi:GMP reductase